MPPQNVLPASGSSSSETLTLWSRDQARPAAGRTGFMFVVSGRWRGMSATRNPGGVKNKRAACKRQAGRKGGGGEAQAAVERRPRSDRAAGPRAVHQHGEADFRVQTSTSEVGVGATQSKAERAPGPSHRRTQSFDRVSGTFREGPEASIQTPN